jgi:hypothetical protein
MSTNVIKFKGAVYAENTSIQVPSGTLYEVKELKSDSLEANSLSITVTSNDTSILKYKKNDKVEYFRDGKRKGIFYLQSVKRVGPNSYSLYGLSALGRLLQRKHVGGIYTGETVATVVQEICGSVPVLIETVYAKIALYGYLPYADGVTTSARDNLVQVLFAIGAWLGTDENGVLRVEKLWDGTASTIGASRISSQNCNVEYLDPISAVEVVEHGYIPDTKEVTLFSGTAQANDLVVFSEPIHDLSATGFTILESGTNYAILSAGTGTLTGKGYLHSTRVIQRPVSVGVEENVLFVDGATLVSLVNSAAVTDRLVNYYKHREQISEIVDVSQERVGHVVNLYHPWDKTLVSACLSEREVSISGILEANTKALVGFLPTQPESSEYFDERVILTGSGEWTVPEGVTSYTRVLIGGGRPVHPGEISLAHGGVLFLDELAEFPTGVLQTLRQPIERGYVRIVRVDGAFTFPSRFQLLAASNPCPCGFLGDREVPCRCSAAMVERYRSKLRGPLADRIDMMIDVTRPDPQVIIEGAEGMSSAELRDYVVRGRAFRAWRESRMDDADAEAEDDETRSIDGVVSTFELDDAAEKCVLGLSKRTHLTGRGIVRLVRIARTIADVAESEQVTQDHVLEAAMYQGRRDQ